ncbi:hypothetical protein GQ457_14G017390 [Hibiscus cannabinus]
MWFRLSALRRLAFEFTLPTSVFRWPDLNLSYLTGGWNLRWQEFSFVDDVLWTFVTKLFGRMKKGSGFIPFFAINVLFFLHFVGA